MVYLKAVLLAVVEGLTEFLPISSTGHLIIVEELVTLGDDPQFADAFMVMIQLPAILSVVVYFWKDLWPFQKDAEARKSRLYLWSKIVLAVLPAVVFGLLLNDLIEEYLFSPYPVAAALALGGLVLIVVDRGTRHDRIDDVMKIGYKRALLIGLFQCLAMFPGTSRSAATIIGGMLLGANRAVAAEFSFFLAIPTMIGATTYKTFNYGLDFSGQQWAVLAVGGAVSFLVAYASIAFLMNYIRTHNFTGFGYYRIVLAVVVVIYFTFVS